MRGLWGAKIHYVGNPMALEIQKLAFLVQGLLGLYIEYTKTYVAHSDQKALKQHF